MQHIVEFAFSSFQKWGHIDPNRSGIRLSMTHAVHNKTTISFNSSMLKKLKSPESSFILKSLIKVASFAEYTCFYYV